MGGGASLELSLLLFWREIDDPAPAAVTTAAAAATTASGGLADGLRCARSARSAFGGCGGAWRRGVGGTVALDLASLHDARLAPPPPPQPAPPPQTAQHQQQPASPHALPRGLGHEIWISIELARGGDMPRLPALIATALGCAPPHARPGAPLLPLSAPLPSPLEPLRLRSACGLEARLACSLQPSARTSPQPSPLPLTPAFTPGLTPTLTSSFTLTLTPGPHPDPRPSPSARCA